ncbi:MAG: hypothetical protein ACRCVX_14165 [Shewanella sp.]
MNKVTHPKGWNLPWPIQPPLPLFGCDGMYITVRFTEQSLYVMPKGDQDDWIKVGGIALQVTSAANTGWAIMLAMHTTLDGKVFCGLYTHGEFGQRRLPEKWVEVPLYEDKTFWLDILPERFAMYEMRGDVAPKLIEQHHGPSSVPYLMRTIGSWFGSNQPAPKKVVYWKKVSCHKIF